MREQPAVYVISGPMAAGKSTVARLLAARFERGVHVEGDVFRRSIVSGRADVTSEPTAEALDQLRLRYRIAAAAADAYADAGFTVALEDVIAGSQLGDLRTSIRGRPCHVVVLLPSHEALAAREAARVDAGYGRWTIEQLHDAFAQGPHVGIWIDNTHLTPEETVDRILEETASQREPLVVTAYDDRWPLFFEQIAAPVREALADLGAMVEHVGSTAVPGLAAKPIVDVDVVVRSPADVPTAIERLRALGYVYQGDKGVTGREAFLWPRGSTPHHMYVVVVDSPPHRNHVDFRDYLRSHPEVARDYAALKMELAARHRDDWFGYTNAKDDFVAAALRSARVGG